MSMKAGRALDKSCNNTNEEPPGVEEYFLRWGADFERCDAHQFLRALLDLICLRAARTTALFDADVDIIGRSAATLARWQTYWKCLAPNAGEVLQHLGVLAKPSRAEQFAFEYSEFEARGGDPLWPLIGIVRTFMAGKKIQPGLLDCDTFWPILLIQETDGDPRRVASLAPTVCYYNTRITIGGKGGLPERDQARWLFFSAFKITDPRALQLLLPGESNLDDLRLSSWMFQINQVRDGCAIFDGQRVHYPIVRPPHNSVNDGRRISPRVH